MILQDLRNAGLISPPSFLIDNTIYLTIMGSEAYGCATDYSDKDIYGITIPSKSILFPNMEGRIWGYDYPQEPWKEWEKHHIEFNKNTYDFKVYSIVQFFNLLRNSNPTILDSIFTSRECVIHSTDISEKIRDNRKLFLSKLAWPKYKGYAYQQLTKMKKERLESNRVGLVAKHGYDTKFASHVVRLLNEAEQIFTKGDLDLRENVRQLISIRNGEWSKEQVIEWVKQRERFGINISKSTLPQIPPEGEVKQLLIDCIEMHYQKIPELHVDKYKIVVNKIIDLINETRDIKINKIKEGTKCIDINFMDKIGYVYNSTDKYLDMVNCLKLIDHIGIFSIFHATSFYATGVIYLRKFHIRKKGKLL